MKVLLSYRGIDNIAGGVERMMSRLLNEMSARGHDMHLLTLDQESATSYYPLDKQITWHKLALGNFNQKASWSLRLKRARAARKIIKDIKPDLILAFQDGAFISMSTYTAFTGIPIIFAERVAPQHYNFAPNGKFKKAITYTAAHLAKAITIQCEDYKPLYPKSLQAKIKTIPNPVTPAKTHASPEGKTAKRKNILCIGRVGYQKNQALLAQTFQALAPQHPDWDLILAGEVEPDHTPLTHPQIIYKGAVKDVTQLYQSAHIFCLPSRWEGFPNALAEALAHGLPAIGFTECGGVNTLIHNNENGLLASGNNNAESLKNALTELMQDSEKRKTFGKNAIKSIQPYTPQKIFDAWENLFHYAARK